MCLNLISINTPVPLIAEKIIHVYKIIDNTNVSVLRRFQYKPNTLYNLPVDLVPIKRIYRKSPFAEFTMFNVHEGFHAYNEFQHWVMSPQKCVEFFIPKGAKYFIGINQDIVSNKIISGSLKPIRN